ncbi:hypothetical protein M8494_32085 [Serratia ureilytica]
MQDVRHHSAHFDHGADAVEALFDQRFRRGTFASRATMKSSSAPSSAYISSALMASRSCPARTSRPASAARRSG